LLKKEYVYRNTFIDYKHARIVLFKYIEGFYNRKGYMTRVGFQKMNTTPTQTKFVKILSMKDRHRKLLGRKARLRKLQPSREAADKMSPAICKALLIGYSDGYFSKQEMSGLLGIKEKHISKFLMEVAKW
jgi:hypothetical protein